MASPFDVLVSNLNQLGFFGFLLPWIFMFAVVYGLLTKTKALGDDLRVNVVVALVTAFFVVGFGGPFLANAFVNIFGLGAIVIAAILIIVLFVAMAGGDVTKIIGSRPAMALLAGIGINGE